MCKSHKVEAATWWLVDTEEWVASGELPPRALAGPTGQGVSLVVLTTACSSPTMRVTLWARYTHALNDRAPKGQSIQTQQVTACGLPWLLSESSSTSLRDVTLPLRILKLFSVIVTFEGFLSLTLKQQRESLSFISYHQKHLSAYWLLLILIPEHLSHAVRIWIWPVKAQSKHRRRDLRFTEGVKNRRREVNSCFKYILS